MKTRLRLFITAALISLIFACNPPEQHSLSPRAGVPVALISSYSFNQDGSNFSKPVEMLLYDSSSHQIGKLTVPSQNVAEVMLMLNTKTARYQNPGLIIYDSRNQK